MITMAELPQPGEEGDGVVVLELCGGLAPTTLAAAVAGLKVARVVYVDLDDQAFLGAQHLHQSARAAYPRLVLAPELERACLPQDVRAITHYRRAPEGSRAALMQVAAY